MQKRKNKKSKKQPWQGAAKSMALGLMCLASFVAAPCPEALAADNLTISGAQGGSCSTPGAWATFNFGTTSYTSGWGGSSAGADFTPTPPLQGWDILLGGGGSGGSGGGSSSGGGGRSSSGGGCSSCCFLVAVCRAHCVSGCNSEGTCP